VNGNKPCGSWRWDPTHRPAMFTPQEIQLWCNKAKHLPPWKIYPSTAFSNLSPFGGPDRAWGEWNSWAWVTWCPFHLFSWYRLDKVRSSHYINAQHWKQRLAFSLKKGYPVPVPHSRLAQACQKNSLFTALNHMCTYYANKVDLHCQSSDQVFLHSGGLSQESPTHCLLCPHTCRNIDLHTWHPSTTLTTFWLSQLDKKSIDCIEEKDTKERVLHILHTWQKSK